MSNYYDRYGNALTIAGWCALMEADDGYRIVARTNVGESLVSTVWLGLDQSFGFGSVPIIFETMIFGGKGDGEQWRWCTEAEAVAGHNRIVGVLMARGIPEP